LFEGRLKLGVFVRLNASARNCKRVVSVTPNSLKMGEIKGMETRTVDLGVRAAEGSKIAVPNGGGHWRIIERCRVVIMGGSARTILGDTRDNVRIAGGRGCGLAGNVLWRTAVEGQDPIIPLAIQPSSSSWAGP
jgi:hypothetical protein